MRIISTREPRFRASFTAGVPGREVCFREAYLLESPQVAVPAAEADNMDALANNVGKLLGKKLTATSLQIGTGATAWKLAQVGNSTSATDLASALVKNSVSPQYAEPIAKQTLDVLKSVSGKTVLIGVAAGGFAWGIVELTGKSWSRRRKWLIIGGIALVAAAIYLTLRLLGVAT